MTCSHSSCLSAHSRLGSQISVQQMKRETSSTFHCMVHGDLFELAEPDWIAQNDPQPQAESSAAGAANGQADAATADDTEHFNHLPAAPKGLVYRQVNEPHSEVMCDIFGKSPSVKAVEYRNNCADGRL